MTDVLIEKDQEEEEQPQSLNTPSTGNPSENPPSRSFSEANQIPTDSEPEPLQSEEILPKGEVGDQLNSDGEVIRDLKGKNKLFRKINKGSLRGAIFSLTAMTIGTGCFSFPIRCKQLGLFWFCLAIILGASVTYWSLSGLINSSRKVKMEDYSAFVQKSLGKVPSMIVDCSLIVFVFGGIVAFQLIIYSLAGRSFYHFFVKDKSYYTEYDIYEKEVWDQTNRRIIGICIIGFLLIPLCLIKNISKMSFLGYLSICSLLYTFLVIIIQSPFFWIYYKNNIYKEDKPDTHPNWFNITNSFNTRFEFFTGMATVFYAYACQPGAFPIYKGLYNNIPRRINKVFRRSVLLTFTMYFFVAIASFLTNPVDPEDLIIYRPSIFKHDIFMDIAKICMMVDLFLCIPLNYNNLRNAIFSLLYGSNEISTRRNLITTVMVLMLSSLMAALYTNILTFLSLIGGFCVTTFGFFIPGCLMIAESGLPLTAPKNIMNLGIVIVLSFMGYAGGIQSVRECIFGT